MGLLGLFSKKKAATKQELKREQDPKKVQPKTNIAESNGVWWNTSNQIDLGAVPDQEELLMLSMNLAGIVQMTHDEVVIATGKLVMDKHIIPGECLDLCIVATERAIQMMSSPGSSPSPRTQTNIRLLEKLKELK